uniref:LIM zinc-binding domain-containing protein n=1 Tax=Timema monikensis TaxID=170555 RepID=A0A7R9EFL8_9NEOP|nr:unnamed protein product [Timema monikensis]
MQLLKRAHKHDVVVGVKPGQEILCHSCQKPVTGKIISALGKTWHPEHFKCASCNEPITSDKFNQQDGKPYCEDDYANLFLKRCAECKEPIKEKVIMALNRHWHEEHFRCAKCDKKLVDLSFFEKEGKPYCQEDYHLLFSPQCHGCKEPITEMAIGALGKKWHQACFTCLKCSQAVVEIQFEVLDDRPICSKCTNK